MILLCNRDYEICRRMAVLTIFGHHADDAQRFAGDLGADIRTNGLYQRVTTIDVRRAPIAIDGPGAMTETTARSSIATLLAPEIPQMR